MPASQLQALLSDLTSDFQANQPKDIVQFCADWFQEKLRQEVSIIERRDATTHEVGVRETIKRSEILVLCLMKVAERTHYYRVRKREHQNPHFLSSRKTWAHDFRRLQLRASSGGRSQASSLTAHK
jgi:hypothetical protein